MKRLLCRHALPVLLGLMALGVGCVKERSVDPDSVCPQGTFFDEPIILSTAGPYEPIEMIENGRVYVFDLSSDSLVQSGDCNDFWIEYVTRNTCDIGYVEVWDTEAASWVNIAFSNSGGCFTAPREQHHLFSSFGLEASSVLDAASQLRVRVNDDIFNPQIWSMRVNPEYWRIPLSRESYYSVSRLANAPGRDHFYTNIGGQEGIVEINREGEVLHRLPSPVELTLGMTFDGENLWVIGVPDSLFKVSLNGEVLCAFSLPTSADGDLAWDGETVWLSEGRGFDPRVWGIDPVASCSAGNAVITASFPGPGGSTHKSGLAWDGSHLLVLDKGGHLYRVTVGGLVIDAVIVPVSVGSGAAWDGFRLCFISSGQDGPTGRHHNEGTITCFRLR